MYWMFVLFITVNIDKRNDKDVADVAPITVSMFKEAHPDDSETGNLIGLRMSI